MSREHGVDRVDPVVEVPAPQELLRCPPLELERLADRRPLRRLLVGARGERTATGVRQRVGELAARERSPPPRRAPGGRALSARARRRDRTRAHRPPSRRRWRRTRRRAARRPPPRNGRPASPGRRSPRPTSATATRQWTSFRASGERRAVDRLAHAIVKALDLVAILHRDVRTNRPARSTRERGGLRVPRELGCALRGLAYERASRDSDDFEQTLARPSGSADDAFVEDVVEAERRRVGRRPGPLLGLRETDELVNEERIAARLVARSALPARGSRRRRGRGAPSASFVASPAASGPTSTSRRSSVPLARAATRSFTSAVDSASSLRYVAIRRRRRRVGRAQELRARRRRCRRRPTADRRCR